MASRNAGPAALAGLLLGVALLAGAAPAQELTRIVAVVNDDAISIHDLTARFRFTAATTGIPQDEAERDELLREVLESLIDERLKQQVSERFGVPVTTAELEAAFTRFAAQYGHTPESFRAALEEGDIPEVTIWSQINADIRWAKIVRSRVALTPDDVDSEIESIRAAEGTPEYLVRRIFLAAEDEEGRARARARAEQLRGEVLAGADFGVVALRHSQSLLDAPGGEWVRGNAVDEATGEALGATEPGNVTRPVEVPGGVYLAEVLDRRVVTLPDDPGQLRALAEALVFRRLVDSADRGLIRRLRADALIDRRL